MERNKKNKLFLIKGLILLTVIAHPAFSQDNVENQIIELDKQLNQLIVEHKSDVLNSYYTNDFLLTTSSGKIKSKQDMLKEIEITELNFEVNETYEVKVRVHENTAVLTGKLHQKGMYGDSQFDNYFLVTDTWIKTDERWQVLAGHATLITK